MIVYWGGCIASMLIAYIGTNTYKGNQHRWAVIFFSAMPLALIAMLRYNVGSDYMGTYVSYFETMRSGYNMGYERMELLYHLINAVVIFLHGDYVWVFVVAAICFFAAVFPQIFRESPYPPLSIFLLVTMGFYFAFLNVMRQMIGCGILLFSMRYIRERKLIPFLICVALASGFHLACAAFVAMYWIGRIRIRPVIAILIVVICFVLNEMIVEIMKNIIETSKYGVYIASIFDVKKTAYVMLTINICILMFASFQYQENEQYTLYFNLQLIAVLVTIFSGEMQVMLRLLWVFGLPSIIFLPLLLSNIQDMKMRKIAIAIVVFLYTVYATYIVGIQNTNGVLPYRFIFERWI